MLNDEHGIFVTRTKAVHVNWFEYKRLISLLLYYRWRIENIAAFHFQNQLPLIEIAAVTSPQ